MKYKLALLFIIWTVLLKSQNVAVITDTLHVRLLKDVDVDSIIAIRDENQFSSPWEVYFDQNKNKLAYKSIIKGDTCFTYDYWRSNGKLKRKTKQYIEPTAKYPIWVYEEIHCENGQLIRETNPNPINKKIRVVNYYCNGKKKSEYTNINNIFQYEGEVATWYENGRRQMQGFYKETKEEGTWNYWNESGDLTKVEIYKDGKLIETK